MEDVVDDLLPALLKTQGFRFKALREAKTLIVAAVAVAVVVIVA